MRWSFTLNDNYTFFCISILFIISFYILQSKASKHQFVLIKFGIRFVVLRDIKTVTAYETHLVEILAPRELGFTDDVQVLVEDDDGELTSRWSVERRFVLFKFIREFCYTIIDIRYLSYMML